MSQDMSTFYTGVRRNLPERVPRTRPAVRTGATPGGGATRGAGAGTGTGAALTGSRNRWPQSGAGVGASAAAGAATGAATGAGTRNRRRPLNTRLTGGGPGPTEDPQSTSTLPARRQAGAMPPGSPRRLREIEWIMKPSKSFIQCSESSSEDSFPDRVSELEKLHDKTGRRRSSWSSGISSSRERLQAGHPTQQLANLLKSSCHTEEPMGQVRTKKRSSRVFCVPDQRIMHSEELLQAQMLQMRPRRAKSPQHYSPCPAPTPSYVQDSPRICSNPASEGVLLHSSATVTLLQPENSYISCSPSPQPSQVPVQPPPSRSHSPCSFEKVNSSSSGSSSSCPSQTLVAEPPAKSNSSKDSSLSTSGTECSAERVVQRYCGPAGGSKAIKLTSTVIKIMPEKAKVPQRVSKGRVGQQTRSKLRSKPTSVFFRKAPKDPATNLAMNAPMIQSIAPPTIMPKVKVSRPIVSQSVNLVANQLTAQLKKAVGEDQKPVREKNKPVKKHIPKATADKGAGSSKLVRKTSIYLLMDQAKPDQAKDEPLPARKNDWVIQPMEQQMISAATEQPKKDNRSLSGSERLNSNTNDSNNTSKVEHNYDKYLNTSKGQGISGGDPGSSRYIPEPIPTQKANQSRKQPQSQLSLKPDSSRTSKPQQKSPYLRPSERSIRSRPVSLNRIPRPRVPPVPLPQQQPRQVQQHMEVITGSVGKIVRKAQHKVPRTMEDGIDMSYQYFVSLPLKRGRKPQVVRYLYRPMVRHLNGLPNRRRSSKRGKSRKAAPAAPADPVPVPAEQPPELHPALVALGGAPLPLEDPALDEEETQQPEIKPALIFDPEAALNSPYNVPPLKLKPRYMPMLEKLDQMPYPDERLNRRRRQRRVRAAGGSEQCSAMEYDVLSLESSGGGDVIAKEKKQRMPVIVWSGRQASPGPRTSVVDYESKPTRLGTTTGASITYHQPLRLTRREGDSRPMIRTITYETIEREEQAEQERQQLEQRQEKEQLESEQLAKVQMDKMKLEQEQEHQEQEEQEQEKQEQEKPMETGQETIGMAKSVSFHLEPVFVSRGSTSAFQSSSSSNVGSKGKSKKRKSKKTHSKGKNRSKGKGKGRK